MYTKNILKNMQAYWGQLAVIIISVSLLSGCMSTPKSVNSKVNSYVSKEYVEQELQQSKLDSNAIGVMLFSLPRIKPWTQAIWINDVPIAIQSSGYIRLALYPGEYVLKTKFEDSESHQIKFTIEKGQIKYFAADSGVSGAFAGFPIKEFTDFFIDPSSTARLKKQDYKLKRQISLSIPRHKLLPEPLKTQVDNCLTNNTFESCNPVYQDIPLALIDPKPREQIVNLMQIEKAKRKEEAMDQALRASLSKSALRDHYMIALSNALSNRDFEKSLPIFERLKGLNMPLDPDFYYFYGEALYETGNNLDALQAITRYINNNGAQAQFYQQALQLLNKIQIAG